MRLELLGEMLHPRAAYIFMLYSSTTLTASDCVCVCVRTATVFMHRYLYLCGNILHKFEYMYVLMYCIYT